MQSASVFITGANRGIGLELTKQLTKLPNPPKDIFATARNIETAEELKKLKTSSSKTNIHLIKMNVTDQNEIDAAAAYATKILGDKGLTVLINNAGIMGITPWPGTPAKDYMEHYAINSVAPIMISEALLPLLKISACKNPGGFSVNRAAIINITGLVASYCWMDINIGREIEAYRMSKTALNLSSCVMARNLKKDGVLVTLVHPGWVQTDMGGKDGDLTPEQSVAGMIQTFGTLGENQHGSYVDYAGKKQDW